VPKKLQKLHPRQDSINRLKGKIKVLKKQLRALEEGPEPPTDFNNAKHLARVRPKNSFGEVGIVYRGSIGNPRYSVRLKEKGKVKSFGMVSTVQEARELSKREQLRIRTEKRNVERSIKL